MKLSRFIFLLFIISAMFLAACKSAPSPEPTPTVEKAILAIGAFEHDPDSYLEISFKPGGGKVRGMGNVFIEHVSLDVEVSGYTIKDGIAKGGMVLSNPETREIYGFDWTGSFADGIFEGDLILPQSDRIDTYHFILEY